MSRHASRPIVSNRPAHHDRRKLRKHRGPVPPWPPDQGRSLNSRQNHQPAGTREISLNHWGWSAHQSTKVVFPGQSRPLDKDLQERASYQDLSGCRGQILTGVDQLPNVLRCRSAATTDNADTIMLYKLTHVMHIFLR